MSDDKDIQRIIDFCYENSVLQYFSIAMKYVGEFFGDYEYELYIWLDENEGSKPRVILEIDIGDGDPEIYRRYSAYLREWIKIPWPERDKIVARIV
jgi:hypothetical protein